jgi:cold shock CspA family protein
MPTGTVTWVDSATGCCFVASDVPGRDLYVEPAQVDPRSRPLFVGAKVQFAVCTGRRGRLVVTNVLAGEPSKQMPEPAQDATELAADVWEGEGGALG